MKRCRRPSVLVLIAGTAALSLAGCTATPRSCPPWSYTGANGPAYWGDLCRAYAACKEGTRQSPLFLAPTDPASLAPLEIGYAESTAAVVNDGHTISAKIQGSGNLLVIGGRRYRLEEIHFHTPSEHRVPGVSFPLEVHLVHRNVDNPDDLAVIGVFTLQGSANPAFQAILDNIAKEVRIDPVQLLPERRLDYRYPGSLTTPPCTQNVTWHVLLDPIEVSVEQISAFRRLYPLNARPAQPRNGRRIEVDKPTAGEPGRNP